MLTLTRKEPAAPFFDELRRDMEGFWDRPFLFRPMRPLREFNKAFEWAPTIDVFEKNGELFVKADLPGVKKENVKVEIADGDLLIYGERKVESEVDEKEFYRSERQHGEFFRRMALNFEPDPAKIEARFADGVLEVKIPYPLERKSEAKKIEIK